MIRMIVSSISTVKRIRQLLNKAMMCFPSFKQITTVMILVFYFYAVVGTEIFNTSTENLARLRSTEDYQYYMSNTVGDF